MDKRFFLALFLSLIVIAISQLLFPPPQPAAVTPSATAKDSTAATSSIASSTEPAMRPAVVATTPVTAPSRPGTGAAAPSDTTVARAAEIITVSTPKAIYRFSNVGATLVSVVTRDYRNRSGSGGPVDLSVGGSPLLGYRLVTPTDTVELSEVPFSLSRRTNAKGDEVL